MKQKVKFLMRVIVMILFIRPNRWKYEIDKLKKEQN
jgi:hypothetical protein